MNFIDRGRRHCRAAAIFDEPFLDFAPKPHSDGTQHRGMQRAQQNELEAITDMFNKCGHTLRSPVRARFTALGAQHGPHPCPAAG